MIQLPKEIAFFDFDGTVTSKDSMLELARFYKGNAGFYTGMILLLPSLISFKSHLITAQEAKEKLLTYFFGGMHSKSFDALCSKFSEQKLSGLLRKNALDKIAVHKNKGHEVVLVSASAENWIIPFCTENKLGYICSKLEVINDCITGKLNGVNCNGPEKATRIKAQYDLSAYEHIHVYGDSSGDAEMLQLATEKHYRAF